MPAREACSHSFLVTTANYRESLSIRLEQKLLENRSVQIIPYSLLNRYILLAIVKSFGCLDRKKYTYACMPVNTHRHTYTHVHTHTTHVHIHTTHIPHTERHTETHAHRHWPPRFNASRSSKWYRRCEFLNNS